MANTPSTQNFTTRLLTSTDLLTNPYLNGQIIELSNIAFQDSMASNPDLWGNYAARFPTPTALADLLKDEGICAALIDEGNGKVVASGSLIPWPPSKPASWQVLESQSADEKGWEIKALVVDPSPQYRGKGLGGQCVAALEKWVIEKEKGRGNETGKIMLFVWLAECINGAYWRRRGFTEIRRQIAEVGIWGNKRGFELVTMVREVSLPGGLVEGVRSVVQEQTEAEGSIGKAADVAVKAVEDVMV